MSKVVMFDHPLIKHKLTFIRDKNTSSKEFRELVTEVSMLMAYEVTRDMNVEEIEIETPIGKTKSEVLAGKKVGLLPILRAGLGMVDGMLKIIPSARVGHIGLYRDPVTLKPVEYYCKLPKGIEERMLIVLDPMVATGGSAMAALEYLKDKGANPDETKLVCLIASKEGIEAIQKEHPEIDIYVAAIDDKLNDEAYIVPGLGDAGDRLFGTK